LQRMNSDRDSETERRDRTTENRAENRETRQSYRRTEKSRHSKDGSTRGQTDKRDRNAARQRQRFEF